MPSDAIILLGEPYMASTITWFGGLANELASCQTTKKSARHHGSFLRYSRRYLRFYILLTVKVTRAWSRDRKWNVHHLLLFKLRVSGLAKPYRAIRATPSSSRLLLNREEQKKKKNTLFQGTAGISLSRNRFLAEIVKSHHITSAHFHQ